MGRAKTALLAFAALAVVTGAALYPLCNLLHRCGCVALWAGGAAACNVHLAAGPHCPWCEQPVLGGLATIGILGVQWLVLWMLRRRGAPLAAATAGALVSLGPALLALGGVLWLATDYPHFLALDTRRRLGVPAGPVSCHGHREAGP
jgi:hypothetical protein